MQVQISVCSNTGAAMLTWLTADNVEIALWCEFTLGNVEVWHAEGCRGGRRPSTWCALQEFKSETGGGLEETAAAGGFIVRRWRGYVRSTVLSNVLSLSLSCSVFFTFVLLSLSSSPCMISPHSGKTWSKIPLLYSVFKEKIYTCALSFS